MKSTQKSARNIFSLVITVALICLMTAVIIPGVMGYASPDPVDLTGIDNYAILAGTGISQASVLNGAITGDIGAPDGTMISVSCPEMVGGGATAGSEIRVTATPSGCMIIDPTVGDDVTTVRQAAFTNANGRPISETRTGSLNGLTLAPGVYYTSGAMSLPESGIVTLDALGDPNAVWIFQIKGAGSGLTTGASSRVILSNGAQPKYIFWVVTGPTSLGANSVLNGNILAGPGTTTIALLNGATVNGRLLTGTDVTLSHNLVTIPTAGSVHGGPNVTSLSPTSGSTAGTTSVIITGTGFTDATSVMFDGFAATITANTDTSITATPPAHAAGGPYTVVVTTPVGSGTKTLAYTYAEPPIVSGILPVSGPTTGGTIVTITGQNLNAANAVTFGSAGTATITANTDTSITATAPAGALGTVHVTVTTAVGTSATSSADQYTYVVPPTFVSIAPLTGSTAGGTAVTITGTNLIGATVVSIGGNTTTGLSVVNGNSITATTPFHASAGHVDVVVTTPNGTTTQGTGAYTYTSGPAAPTISSISPVSGPTTVGTLVNITGTNLADATSVTFGSNAATSITKTATTINMTAPAGISGSVTVTVNTPSGSATTSYIYAAGPANVNLGSAGDFVILAKTAITNAGDPGTSTTSIVGDVGISPAAASYITGFALDQTGHTTYATSSLVTGKVYASNYADTTPAKMTSAISNMETAYTDAAGRAPGVTELGAGTLTDQTLVPGVYKWGTAVTIPTDLTLDAQGDANAVWIFQIARTLDISSGKHVILSGGAQASNIYWQVAETTTLGTNSVFVGTILDQTNIAIQTGATLNGRALAQSAVTLDGNKLNVPPATLGSGPTGYNGGSDDFGSVSSGPSSGLGLLAPIAASGITPVTVVGPLTSTPLTADLVGMPGVVVSWTTQINDNLGPKPRITTVITQYADQSTLDAITAALQPVGLDIDNVAYGMMTQKTDISSTGKATVSMTASRDWVAQNGNDAIRIVRVADDGTIEVLSTWYDGNELNSNYPIFTAASPQGLATFWLVSVKPYTPALASVSADQQAPAAVQLAPTQAPAASTTPMASTGGVLPVMGIAGVAAIAIIGVALMLFTPKKK